MELVMEVAWAPRSSSPGDLCSGHCTDRGALTVNCWENDYKPARTAPTPNILTACPGLARGGGRAGESQAQSPRSLLPPASSPGHPLPPVQPPKGEVRRRLQVVGAAWGLEP